MRTATTLIVSASTSWLEKLGLLRIEWFLCHCSCVTQCITCLSGHFNELCAVKHPSYGSQFSKISTNLPTAPHCWVKRHVLYSQIKCKQGVSPYGYWCRMDSLLGQISWAKEGKRTWICITYKETSVHTNTHTHLHTHTKSNYRKNKTKLCGTLLHQRRKGQPP